MHNTVAITIKMALRNVGNNLVGDYFLSVDFGLNGITLDRGNGNAVKRGVLCTRTYIQRST
jgi:hypothetical protein